MDIEKPNGQGVGRQNQNFLQKISSKVDSGISGFFEGLGRFVSRRPYIVIVSSIILAIGCGIAFGLLLEQELDGEDLYTPESAQSFKDRGYVVDTFGEPAQEVRVLVTRSNDLRKDSDCSKWNLFVDNDQTKGLLLEYMTLYDNIEKQTITYKGEVFNLTLVCQKPDETKDLCEVRSILDLWGYDRKQLEADEDVLGRIENAIEQGTIQSRLGVPISFNFLVGLNKGDDGCKGNVEVLQMSFALQNNREDVDGETIDPRSNDWTYKLVETVTEDWENENSLIGYVSSIEAVDKESEDAIDRDVARLTIGYVLVIVFSHFVLFKDSPVFCKLHLATASVISVGMSIITAFGLAQIFGVRFNLVVQTLPFLLLGLGMDDTFVIMGAYRATSLDQSVEDRMAETMARAGSSILVTSVTDAVAFIVGTYTELPALQAFTIYAFLGIIFDFIYQVTFFAAFVALDARREQRALNGAPVWGFQLGRATTEFDKLPPTQPPANPDAERGEDEEREVPSVINGKNWKRRMFPCKKKEFDHKAPSTATKIVGEWLPKVTLHPVGIVVILLIEAGVLAGAIYGCTKVKMDFQFRDWFVPDGSYLKDAFKVEEQYFSGDQQPFSVFTKKPTDGRDFFYHQDDYLNLVNAIRTDDYVADLPPVTSWYEAFSTWLEDEDCPFIDDVDKPSGRAPNATSFTACVRYFLQNVPAGKFYNGSVTFDADGIESTKFNAYTLDVKDGNFAIDTVDSIREAAEAAAPKLDAIAYSGVFLFYDGFKVITWETVRNVLMAGVAVFVITTVVLANVVASLIVTIMIALTDIMLFGFLWYAGLTFNTVTAINMVLAIGIAVDYSAHIAHSFLVIEGTRKERAQGALHHIGGEVLAGAFTTWLAIVVMGFAEHYIFKAFFRMFFAIVVTGAWHGLVILPIFLRIIGPAPYISDGVSH